MAKVTRTNCIKKNDDFVEDLLVGNVDRKVEDLHMLDKVKADLKFCLYSAEDQRQRKLRGQTLVAEKGFR